MKTPFNGIYGYFMYIEGGETMYVDPFWAGVLSTLFLEGVAIIGLILWALMLGGKHNRK